jgi:hypothetical protein
MAAPLAVAAPSAFAADASAQPFEMRDSANTVSVGMQSHGVGQWRWPDRVQAKENLNPPSAEWYGAHHYDIGRTGRRCSSLLIDLLTFSDITLATAIAFSKFPINATPLDERFEHLDAFWRRWQLRPSFQAAYADGNSGIPELDALARSKAEGK